jgi:hypothetical protein
MRWKLSIYGFNQLTGMPFGVTVFMDEDRQDETLIAYMNTSNCILYAAELEKVNES